MIPATRGIRHCASREGMNLSTKKMATVRTDRRIPITVKEHEQQEEITGIKNRDDNFLYEF